MNRGRAKAEPHSAGEPGGGPGGFLYGSLLGRPLGRGEGGVRARRPKRLPVVLTPDEMDGRWPALVARRRNTRSPNRVAILLAHQQQWSVDTTPAVLWALGMSPREPPRAAGTSPSMQWTRRHRRGRRS